MLPVTVSLQRFRRSWTLRWLLAAGKPDEAAAVAAAATASGRVMPSNWWRASEIVAATDAIRLREASELREVYKAHRPTRPTRHSGDALAVVDPG